jgi:hypothetical protein
LTTQHHSLRKTLALTSPTSGGRSDGIVRSRTQATDVVYVLFFVCVMDQSLTPLSVSDYVTTTTTADLLVLT